MKYDTMDEDSVQPVGNMIPIAIAVLACVLGAVGLYFGFSANKRLNSIDMSIQESSASVEETEQVVAYYDSRISELETKLSDQSMLINRLKAYVSQSEQAVKKLANELNVNRDQIEKTDKLVKEIRAGGLPVRSVAGGSSGPSSRNSNEANASPTRSGAARTYTIVSGDNFSKIAARFGVSVQAIGYANPGVDSRRLAIGQEIVIPATE